MDVDRAADLFSAFGPVSIRRMFGGAGVYADGVMFALEARGTLYLKSDPATGWAFELEGCEAFSYRTRASRRVITSYRRAPASALEEPEVMAVWARKALAVARGKRRAKSSG